MGGPDRYGSGCLSHFAGLRRGWLKSIVKPRIPDIAPDAIKKAE